MRTYQTAFGVIFLGILAAGADLPDASTVMTKVAANVAGATDARRQYVYQQKVRSSMVRTNGQVARREVREYTVVPKEKTTEKTLVSFSGEYRDGKQMVLYSKPGEKDKGSSLDRGLIQELADGLVNSKDSRDGIPHNLFPLRSEELRDYKFSLKGEADVHGRHTYDIAFEPVHKEGYCIHVGDDHEGDDCPEWKGEAWIDAQEFQPVRIETQLAKPVPWGIKVFLGTNVRQLGFSIDYLRVAENVWFPVSYGTEFRLDVLWGYKRTITLSLESNGFKKTDANSTIRYDLEESASNGRE